MEPLLQGGKRLKELLGRYKYILLVIFVGVLLLLWPFGTDSPAENDHSVATGITEEAFSVSEQEDRLARILSEIDGAGEVTVMLTVKSGTRRVVAQDKSTATEADGGRTESTAVVVSTGSGTEEAVLLQEIYPQFQGALVVAEGGGDPAVRLKLMEAVSALTGLGSDKISICKGK